MSHSILYLSLISAALTGFAFGIGTCWYLIRRAKQLRTLSETRVQKIGPEMLVTFSDGVKYRGSCTVWHTYPDGVRASTEMESRLADVWTRAQWEERS